MGRTILITGSSSGIGLDAARTLSARGWRVFATCRQEKDCEARRSEGLESFRLDYEDAETIAAAAAEVFKRTGGTLDALFNNGAYAIPGAVEDLPTDALRANFEANFFGCHELTRLIIPAMRAQGHGRIVQCSSVLGFSAYPWRGSYVATKFALEGLTDTMRIEMRDTGIKFTLIEPGPIGTMFRQNAQMQFEKWIKWESSARAEQYRDELLPRLHEQSSKPDRFELGAAAVTEKLIHALEAKNPRPRYYVTTPTYIAGWMNRVLPTRALDWIKSRA